MVTAAMVIFPKELQVAGWKLLDALDADKQDCSGLFFAEYDEDRWRFFLVSERVKEGYRPYWRAVDQTMSDRLTAEERSLLLDADIALYNPDELVIEVVRRRYQGKPDDRNNLRLRFLTPGQAYIYRLD